MADPTVWQSLFEQWPEGVPRRGIVVTRFGDQVPFESFLIRDQLLLLERNAPDQVGARKVILQFAEIEAVKIVDPIRTKVFVAAGFVESAAAPVG